MKTLNLRLLTAILPPAALFVCQCAPTGGNSPPTAGFFDFSALHTTLVSFGPESIPPLEILFAGAPSEDFENEAPKFDPPSPTYTPNDDSDALQLSPVLVVADLPYSNMALEDWPSNVVDAKHRREWMKMKGDDPTPPHPTNDSVGEWLDSLR